MLLSLCRKALLTGTMAFLSLLVTGQVPAGYYNRAQNKTGEELRKDLNTIIRSHTELSYTPGLWNAYRTTDRKPNGKLWDIYSDRPGGTASYEYIIGDDQCGSSNPNREGGCYNREHTWPKSKFNSNAPMYTDVFLVYPTDYYVNNRRGNMPYGKVNNPTETFTNGTKIGPNAYPGGASVTCFEPIDSFKGDIARIYFYVATCYRNDSAAFLNWEMASKLTFTSWTRQMLLEWHHSDPVSQKEIDRNNAAYAIQGNRNPFVDSPRYADCIWGTTDCSQGATAVNDRNSISSIRIYPNPARSSVIIDWPLLSPEEQIAIEIITIDGKLLYHKEQLPFNNRQQVDVSQWSKGIYIIRIRSDKAIKTERLIVD